MNIKKLRESKRWKQSNLAEKLGVSQKVICDYERNIRKPPIERLPKIAALFGISIEQLLGVKEIKTNINEVSVHGNKRVVKLQEIFEQLGPADQRSVLKHASSLLANK